MRKTLYFAVIGLAALFAFNSCDGDNGDTTTATLDITVPADVPAAGGEVTFGITSNVEWTIADTAEEWITDISPKTGTGNMTVTVTAAENTGEDLRTADLTVTGGGLVKNVTVTQKVTTLADLLVGEWAVNGYWFQEFTAFPDEHYLTIEKIDDNTVRITDLMGLATRWTNMTSEQDTFIAAVDNANGTISIAPQTIEPTFDPDGWPVYMCRFKDDFSAGWDDNWQTGFEDIPVSVSDMTIDFSAGGFPIEPVAGKMAYGSFVPLTMDPSGTDPTVYSYNWYFAGTVWTKGGVISGNAAPASAKELKPANFRKEAWMYDPAF